MQVQAREFDDISSGNFSNRPDLSSIAKEIATISSLNKKNGFNTIVSICGGSCTGKSTQVAAGLYEILGETQIISQDHFMLASRCKTGETPYGWDHPDSFNLKESAEIMDQLCRGIPCSMPNYSFQTLAFSKVGQLCPSIIVLFEGLYAGYSFLRDHADYIVYVEMPLYARIIRRLLRNMYERYTNSDPRLILESYLSAPLSAHRDFVTKQKDSAHVVWSSGYDFRDAIKRFNLKGLGAWNDLRVVHSFPLPNELCFKIENQSAAYYFSICFRSAFFLQFEIGEETVQSLLKMDFMEL